MRISDGRDSRVAKILQACAVIACGLALSLALLGPLRNSKIALVDENDIPQYMGTAGKVEFSQILSVILRKTEVGAFGESDRMRPAYYVTRVIETALWGNEGRYWYTWRIVMFGLAIAVMGWIYWWFAGVVLGAVLTVYTLSFDMWADIWARSTGPSEQYAVAGAALVALGALLFLDRWKDRRSLDGAAMLMALGGVLAMGSKENMLFLEVPLTAALFAGIARRRLGIVSAVFLIGALGIGLWVASSIAWYLHNTKLQDMYGHSLFSGILTSRLMRQTYIFVVVSAAVLAAGDRFVKIRYPDKLPASRAIALQFIVWACICLLVLLSQQVFYSGRLVAHMRYDFPGLIAVPALIVVMVLGLRRACDLLVPDLRLGRVIVAVVAFALAGYTGLKSWAMPDAVAANVQRTRAFDAGLSQTQSEASAKPDWPIVVRSYNPWDYEIVQALGILFVARGVKNPLFLVHAADKRRARTAFENDVLDKVLDDQSRDGVAGRGYLPLADFDKTPASGCFVIALERPDVFEAEPEDLATSPAGLKCRQLALHIYWNGGTLVFQDP